jgi:hypothetical protein
MNKRHVYFVGWSVVVGTEIHSMGREITADRPITSITDINGWVKTGIVDYLAAGNPGWDARSGTWRNQVAILSCSLLRTEIQQPNGEWTAA